jgi:glycerol-3-phosphate dehydrogenase
MNKKEYVLDLLKKLEPYRDTIAWIIAMVELWNCTNEEIDSILQIIETHIKEINNDDIKAKWTQVQEILKKIKDTEALEKNQEIWEIEELLNQINTL